MRYFLGKGSCRLHQADLFSKEIHFRLSVYDVLIRRRGDEDKGKNPFETLLTIFSCEIACVTKFSQDKLFASETVWR
jgi:hypothetical protein